MRQRARERKDGVAINRDREGYGGRGVWEDQASVWNMLNLRYLLDI